MVKRFPEHTCSRIQLTPKLFNAQVGRDLICWDLSLQIRILDIELNSLASGSISKLPTVFGSAAQCRFLRAFLGYRALTSFSSDIPAGFKPLTAPTAASRGPFAQPLDSSLQVRTGVRVSHFGVPVQLLKRRLPRPIHRPLPPPGESSSVGPSLSAESLSVTGAGTGFASGCSVHWAGWFVLSD